MIKQTITLIFLKGDQDEVFSNYGYNEEKSMVLCSDQKRQNPYAFSGTVLNKYKNELLNEKNESFSKLIFFLSLKTERKEK